MPEFFSKISKSKMLMIIKVFLYFAKYILRLCLNFQCSLTYNGASDDLSAPSPLSTLHVVLLGLGLSKP